MSVVRRLFAIAVVVGIARGHGSHAIKEEKHDAAWDAEGYAAEHVCSAPAAFFVYSTCLRCILRYLDAQGASYVRPKNTQSQGHIERQLMLYDCKQRLFRLGELLPITRPQQGWSMGQRRD